jgi:hypothetical protein
MVPPKSATASLTTFRYAEIKLSQSSGSRRRSQSSRQYRRTKPLDVGAPRQQRPKPQGGPRGDYEIRVEWQIPQSPSREVRIRNRNRIARCAEIARHTHGILAPAACRNLRRSLFPLEPRYYSSSNASERGYYSKSQIKTLPDNDYVAHSLSKFGALGRTSSPNSAGEFRAGARGK